MELDGVPLHGRGSRALLKMGVTVAAAPRHPDPAPTHPSSPSIAHILLLQLIRPEPVDHGD
jgi:hypothetical protein